ncbi:MAG: Peptidylprolyl isomerase [Frankiales bacterium]|nr:Peptidylprolyl isomerase [Frankiales bacterium]
MKQALVLTTVLLASLTACSGGNTSTVGQAPTPTLTPTPTTTPVRLCPTPGPATDLSQKPAYTVPTAPAPAETTTRDLVVGTGPAAKSGQSVTVKYVGVNYKTGAEFDSSWKVSCDNTFAFDIGGNVIPGFSKGVTGMQVGGRRLVVIPPKDGYGDQGPVPGGTLAFIIDLVAIG